MPHEHSMETEAGARVASLQELKDLARERIPAAVFDYIDCGACDGLSDRANRADLDELRLLPLVLRDVSQPSLSLELLGRRFSAPIGVAPTAFHRLVHADGEVATARAAGALELPMMVSCMSSLSLEEIAKQSRNPGLWLQTYIFKDRDLTASLLRRAEKAGYQALVLTAGCPAAGKRDQNIRNGFALPDGITAANFGPRPLVVHNNPIHSIAGADLDPSVTWRDLEWLRGETRLPVVLKGIMNPVDAAHAADLQVAAIIVSNHGGRQLDTTESTIGALPAIAAAVKGRLPLLVDGGFRRGTDVVKAVALGADAVLLGRPVMWALALAGEAGVSEALRLLIDEFQLAVQLAGCRSLADIRAHAREIVRPRDPRLGP